jgi:hypothetical protein
MIRSFPPHPNPLPPGERVRPFIPPAELGGILKYFDKKGIPLIQFEYEGRK